MFCPPVTVLSSGDPVVDDPDVALEFPPVGGDRCPVQRRRAVKDGACHPQGRHG